MTMFGEQLLSALSSYGVPLLCVVTFVSSAGIPLPVSLLLIAAGSFADHGEMNAFTVIACATAAAVAGDHVGFAVGRWGDRRLAKKISSWIGGEERLKQAETHARKWGGLGVFLTRWLLTPLGPCINLISGFAGYPWPRFMLWDVLGELLWVVLYVTLGQVFSHRVQTLDSAMGNASWSILALGVAALLGWKLTAYLRSASQS